MIAVGALPFSEEKWKRSRWGGWERDWEKRMERKLLLCKRRIRRERERDRQAEREREREMNINNKNEQTCLKNKVFSPQ